MLWHKLDKCRIFTKQLGRGLFKCREGYSITILKDKDLAFYAAVAQEENRISIKSKQYSIVFLVLFSLL